jgi:hypothetical protein
VGLFLPGPFTSRAGLLLPFKIEADALSADDWAAIAAGVVPRLPPFGIAVGVPRGGLPLARALAKYATPGDALTLVCEDCLTTGGSLAKVWDAVEGPRLGLALFARGPLPPGVRAVFHEADWLTEGRLA